MWGIQFDEPLLNSSLDASASEVDAFENPRPGGMKQPWTLLSEFGGRRKAVRDRLALQGGTGDFP